MNISILGKDSQSITVGCKCAYLMNNDKLFTQIERVLFAVLMSVSLTVVVGLFILLCFALNEALILLA